MKWISVKDRLPTDTGLYLCCGSTIDWSMREDHPDTVYTAWFRDDGEWYERTRDYEEVLTTHWMPLPELPKQ